ncbi:Wiskott-Aldrich syndrome protein family member 1 [Sciurus carolinensis]|uniref:Wiskott-Aldrich syndrome protein family member 1 n=1 Tax=Sciurus carolinensis TaxID=30640 RepID=A0AA41SVA4_SCICA|nr:Wiskott-Aldrich syndrome protein family member 1 [Sciurus carolinensis]
MSFDEEKDEQHPHKLAVSREFQDELIYVIQTSVYNVATQVNNLNKYAEDLIGGLSNEIENISRRLNALQEHVIQLTEVINNKDAKKELSLPAVNSEKDSQSTAIQTKQVRTSEPLPFKTYETHDVSVQTLPINMPITYFPHDGEVLEISCDASYCFETFKEKITPQSIEEKQEKLKHRRKNIYHPNEIESVPQIQLMKNYVPVNHIQDAYREVSHSCVNQPDACSPPSAFPFSEISKLLTRAVGKVLCSPVNMPRNGAGDLKNSLTYVNYGTGMGEVVQPQPRIRLKTEVFVSPTAPTPPPPLPPDWLALLRASKMATPPPIVQSPPEFPPPILRTSEETPTNCLETTPKVGLPITPPKMDLPPPVPKPLQYYEISQDLFPQDKENTPSPPISPFPIISHRIERKNTVSDLVDCASDMQSPTSLAFPSARSSSAKSPRPSAEKSPKCSVLPTPRSSLPPPTRYLITSSAPLPRYSIPQTSKSSASLSCSAPKEPRSSIPSSRYSFSQSTRSSIAPSQRHLNVQSTRPSTATGWSSVAQASGHLTSPQRSSSLKSTRSFNLQSLFSFTQSPPPCMSSPQALTVPQSSSPSDSPGTKLSPSTTPIFSKARNVLMDAIRKGVLLRKTEDHCILKAKIDISKNEETSILIHRKAIGYNCDNLETKGDWIEENEQNK